MTPADRARKTDRLYEFERILWQMERKFGKLENHPNVDQFELKWILEEIEYLKKQLGRETETKVKK